MRVLGHKQAGRRARLILAALALLLFAAAPAWAEKRVALVIGISAYAELDPRQGSPFAKALLARLKSSPGTPFREVFDAVAEDVKQVTRGSQRPEILVRGGAPKVCLAGRCGAGHPQPPMSEAAQAWSHVKDSADPKIFEAFRKQYGAGSPLYDQLAANRIEELKRQRLAAHTPAPQPGEPPPVKPTGYRTVAWDKTFGGAKSDWAKAIAVLPDGGLAVAGHTESKGAGGRDAWVLRLDANGTLLWDKTFGGKEWDGANAIAALPDGGLAVAGFTTSKGAGDEDASVLRLNANGQLLWDKTFGGAKSDGAMAIAVLPDGGLAVAGRKDGTDPISGGDAWVFTIPPEDMAPTAARQ